MAVVDILAVGAVVICLLSFDETKVGRFIRCCQHDVHELLFWRDEM